MPLAERREEHFEFVTWYAIDAILLWSDIFMAWRVEFHDAFLPEFEALAEPVKDALLAHLLRLQEFGPKLGRPAVDTIKGSRIANLKELRFDANGGAWRVLFAFDGRRVAVLLTGGDKAGVAQARFYRRLVAIAEARWAKERR
jgi:hypothetical protein